jgi:uncharacterized C2H2 Zn-finger protein
MSKCCERQDPNGSMRNVYKCPYCDFISKSQQTCERHVYKEHGEQAHSDTEKELNEYKDKMPKRD